MASLLLNTVQNTFYKHKINEDSSLLILKNILTTHQKTLQIALTT